MKRPPRRLSLYFVFVLWFAILRVHLLPHQKKNLHHLVVVVVLPKAPRKSGLGMGDEAQLWLVALGVFQFLACVVFWFWPGSFVHAFFVQPYLPSWKEAIG